MPAALSACVIVTVRLSIGLSTSSSTPVTVTVCGWSQSSASNARLGGLTVAAVAVPLATFTVTSPVGWLSSTTVYAALCSSTAVVVASSDSRTVTSVGDTVTPFVSLSTIVPPNSSLPAAMLVPADGLLRLSLKVSSSSSRLSPFVATETVLDVSPIANISVPLAAV